MGFRKRIVGTVACFHHFTDKRKYIIGETIYTLSCNFGIIIVNKCIIRIVVNVDKCIAYFIKPKS